jgi:hypothetical protein
LEELLRVPIVDLRGAYRLLELGVVVLQGLGVGLLDGRVLPQGREWLLEVDRRDKGDKKQREWQEVGWGLELGAGALVLAGGGGALPPRLLLVV